MPDTDLDRLLHGLAAVLRQVLDRRITVDVDVPPDCPDAACEARALEATVVEAVRRLRDAMLNSGHLLLQARADADDGRVAVRIDAGAGNEVTLRLTQASRPVRRHEAAPAAHLAG